MSKEIRDVVVATLNKLAAERNLVLPAIADSTEIVDELGFTSMMVAGLIASLEEEFGVDPFMDEDVMITDIRTVGDLCAVYAKCASRSC